MFSAHGQLRFTIIVCIALFVFEATIPSKLCAQVTGDVELLSSVAKTWRANFEAIKSWHGRVEIRIDYLDPKSVAEDKDPSVSTALFWYSQEHGAIKRIYERQLGPPVGEVPDVLRLITLKLPDAVHTLGPIFPAREGKHGRTAIANVKAPESDRGGYTTADFNPLIWMQCEFHDVDRRMLHVKGATERLRAAPSGSKKREIHQDGSLVSFSSEFDVESHGYSRVFRFDLEKGGLPIHLEWNEPQTTITTQLKLTPEFVAPAWVPRKATYHYGIDPSKEKLITVKWIENRVNEPIPDSVFDPESLPLVKGDPITDSRTRTMQRFGVDVPAEPVATPARRHWGVILIALFVTAFFTVRIVVGLRKSGPKN